MNKKRVFNSVLNVYFNVLIICISMQCNVFLVAQSVFWLSFGKPNFAFLLKTWLSFGILTWPFWDKMDRIKIACKICKEIWIRASWHFWKVPSECLSTLWNMLVALFCVLTAVTQGFDRSLNDNKASKMVNWRKCRNS